MPQKQTAASLALQLQKAERKIAAYKKAVKAMKKRADRFREMVEMLPDTIFEMDPSGNIRYGNPKGFGNFRYTLDDFRRGANALDLIVPEDRERAMVNMARVLDGERSGLNEYTALRKDGTTFAGLFHSSVIVSEGKPVGIRGFILDITEKKRLAADLKAANRKLEKRVAQRTAALTRANARLSAEIESRKKTSVALEEKTEALRNANVALRVLLRQREQDKAELEDRVANNLRSLVMPYIEKLKKSRLNDRQQTCLDMLSGNVANILSSFARKLSPAYLNLTPTEILVANLIKEGKTSKEIGEALNTSFKTIEGHRRSIRKKTGIAGRKVDLKTHLAALDSGAGHPAQSPNIGSWLPFRPKTNRSTNPAARM